MNRRTLFGRLATVAAAATVAAHVETAQGDAAPETRTAEAEIDRLRETPEFQAEITRLAGRMYDIECPDCATSGLQGRCFQAVHPNPCAKQRSDIDKIVEWLEGTRSSSVTATSVAIAPYAAVYGPGREISCDLGGAAGFVPGDVVSADMFNQTPLVIGNGDAAGGIVASWNNAAQTTPILEFKRDENGTPMIVVPPGVKHDAAFGALVDLWNKGQHDA